MELLFKFILGLMSLITGLIVLGILVAIAFFINPILGILAGLFFVSIVAIVVLYGLRKDLIMKFLGWIFGAKK